MAVSEYRISVLGLHELAKSTRAFICVVLGVIVFLEVSKATLVVMLCPSSVIRTQGHTAQTLGIPADANPELDPAARRLWLDGYMEARRAHLRSMGMLRSNDGSEYDKPD